MLGSFFSAIGGSIGKYIGGGILSSIGRYAGKYIGDFLERKWFHKKEVFQKYASLKESFTLSTATLGSPIPLVFGKTRVFGKIIWADEIKNVAKTSSTSRYFGQPKFFRLPKQAKSTTYYTEYEYFLSFAVAICQGEIREITKVWNGNEIIDISHYKFRLYKGSPGQMPDPYIQAKLNGQAPAFRDLAYIVFEDLPLADFDDVIPNLSFEVTRKANVPSTYTVEDMVKSIVMIPGSGEYVYDTVVQKKQIIAQNGSVKCEKLINSHNLYNIANSIHSLNQLKNTCENLEWVAPVVCWFGNSLDLSECLIRPAVEFKDRLTRFSEQWRVGEYNRENATLRLPFVMTVAEAAQIGRLLLKNAATENKILEFNLPISYIDLEPADFISLEYKEAKYYLRVIKISFTGLVINVIAVVDDINSYHNITNFKNRIELFYEKNIETEVRVIQLPFKLYGYDFPYITVHLNNKIKLPLYVRTKQNLNPNWNKIALIEPTNSITRIVNFHVVGESNPFLIDELGTIEIRGIELEKLNDNNWKLLEINSELIAFKNIKKIPSEEEIYSISYLIRGTYGTQGHIKKHEAGSVATIFTQDVNILPVLEDAVGQTLEFKIGPIVEEVHFINCASHYSIPLTVLNYVEGSKLHLCWVTRNFNLDSWTRGVGRLKDFSIRLTAKSQVLNFTAAPEANQIEIDISDVDISEGYKIDII